MINQKHKHLINLVKKSCRNLRDGVIVAINDKRYQSKKASD